MQLPPLMTIGQAVNASQVSAKAIRQYEDLGLLPPVVRRGTYRAYDSTHIQAIMLIRQAQKLGFTLAELKSLGKDDCTPDWPRFIGAIAAKRQAIQTQIQLLQQRDQALADLDQFLPLLMSQTTDCNEVASTLINKKA
jgi:DNA-binding transcriptional MerR regulator